MQYIYRKTKVYIQLLLFFVFFIKNPLPAQMPEAGLITEIMLNPLDSHTGYTLHKGEWIYNQALTPYPSWFWWGITNWLTVELDGEAWLGSIPSLNFRFALADQRQLRPSLVYETMYQYLSKKINLLDDYQYLRVVRQGNSWYHRLNASWQLSERLRLHLSLGLTYSQYLLIENAYYHEYSGKEFTDLLSPDLSAGFGWRIKEWFSFHSTVSYGSTFTYLDNVPLKYQFTYGFRLAPFRKNKRSILRNLRIEVASLFFYFPEAKETLALPLPLFPYFYWQWGGK